MPEDDNDTQRSQVLDDVSEAPEIAGMSQVGLIGFLLPTLACWFILPVWLPPSLTPWLLLTGLLSAIMAVVVILATPSHMPAGQYAKTLYRYYTQQPELIHE